MTSLKRRWNPEFVFPTKAGIQCSLSNYNFWTPAFAVVTVLRLIRIIKIII